MNSEKIKTLPKALIKSILMLCLATAVIGISLGSLAAAYELPLWIPVLLAATVLAGAAEFTFIGMVAAGSSPVTAALAGLVINLRHLAFGCAISGFIASNRLKFIACHIMNDESVLFGLSQQSIELKRVAYWICGIGILFAWPTGVVLGYFLGSSLPYAKALGIDAIFPAVLFALTFKTLKRMETRKSAISGALISIAAFPLLPAGLPVLASLLGLYIGRK